MSLFLTMLPIYLFGNLHCIGMCGPLVALLGRHHYRWYYFLGRTVAFGLAGWIAGALGAVLDAALAAYHVPAVTSFVFGTVIITAGTCTILGRPIPGITALMQKMSGPNQKLSLLLLKDRRWPTFLFGMGTILLPCGQTLLVYSAIALIGDPWVGLINGLAFAVLTSPSLFLAMHAVQLLGPLKRHYNTIVGVMALLVGALAICRGFAEVQLIPHWVVNPDADAAYHIVLY